MPFLRSDHPATGGPGITPRWTRSDKEGSGTAYSASSKVWYTISKGVVNEVYYPAIDKPQIRDLQYMITDGKTFFHGERQLITTHECLAPGILGFRMTNADPDGRYRIIKEVIADPSLPCVLIQTRLEANADLLKQLRLFAILAPHLEVGGWNNNANVVEHDGEMLLSANKGETWLVMAPSIPFLRCSCGYVGTTDGWQDVSKHLKMDFHFDSATNGNLALTGEIDLRSGRKFTLALGFGKSLHQALVNVSQSLGNSFGDHRVRFTQQWVDALRGLHDNESATGDNGQLYRASYATILAHEDKTSDGALIASMSIPWGEAMTDSDLGGYHLVWTRDMCHAATGLLAAGNHEVPLRALIYLACTQQENGGFFQNFWINGEPYWRGIQLDEVAFPIILAWHLQKEKALKEFDPFPMVLKAATYLIEHGPVTPQERWEEASGYSPSTLAAHIAALICAADFARERKREITAIYLEEYADFLESHVEDWTVTTQGTLLPGIARHFIRIHPAEANDVQPDEVANNGELELENQPPNSQRRFPAKEIVDAGFLELVRYGIRLPREPVIEDSVQVVDAVLKVNTPFGPCWRRYNHDGYGQRTDGGPFLGWGYGHAWPVLTGERGHYELAAGRDARPFIQAMERFASSTKLLPEQVWSLPDLPAAQMVFGRPTGGAMPLVWAHGEYLKLVRSSVDGRVFDLIEPVRERYCNRRSGHRTEIWKFNRQVRSVPVSARLRIQAAAPFRLHWSDDEWNHVRDSDSVSVDTGHQYVDLDISPDQQAAIRFTFFWTNSQRWEGRDFQVLVDQTKVDRSSVAAKTIAPDETVPVKRPGRKNGKRPAKATKRKKS